MVRCLKTLEVFDYSAWNCFAVVLPDDIEQSFASDFPNDQQDMELYLVSIAELKFLTRINVSLGVVADFISKTWNALFYFKWKAILPNFTAFTIWGIA